MAGTTKYHVNKETGRAGICRATKKGCPLGDDTPHFDTKEEAKAYIEKSEAENNDAFATVSKKKSPDYQLKEKGDDYFERYNKYNNPGATRKSYVIPEENYNKSIRAIDRANAKLEKNGIEGRFEYDITERFIESTDDYGNTTARKVYDIKLNEPSFSYKGYKFLAAANKEDGGIIVKSREAEFNGWKPESMACEHCGQNRARTKTFLIKSPDGEVKQIGSSCMDAYMGIRPEGLNVMEFEMSDWEIKDEDDYISSGAGSSYQETDHLLAISLAVSNNGENYQSSQYDYSTSTSSQVYRYLNPSAYRDEEDIKWREEITAKVEQLQSSGEVDKFKRKLQKLEGNNDYVSNVKTLANGEWVSNKNSNLLISSVSIIGREKREAQRAEEARLREEEKANRVQGHYGEVGQKIPKGTTFKVTKNSEYETYNPYTRDNEMRSRVTMTDDEGHNIVWFASRVVDVEEGADLEISSGKVKKHGQYDDQDQTIISNVRLADKRI